MSRSLQVRKLELVVVEPDQVGLDVEAALTEGENVNFAIPEATFEIRIGVQRVYEGKSDAETGAFSARNIPVSQFGPNFELAISANDEGGTASFKKLMDTKDVKREIEARRLEKEAASQAEAEAARKSSLGEMDKKRQIKESIRYALATVGSNDNSVATAAFEVLVKHDDHPLVDREIGNVAKQYSDQFIKYSHLYYKACWAEGVLCALAELEPQKILKKMNEFYMYDWAKGVVVAVASCNADLAFSEIEHYEYMPWAFQVAMWTAESSPQSAIKHYAKYRDQPWAAEVLSFAKNKAEEIESHSKADKAKRKAKEAVGQRIDSMCELFSQPHSESDEINAFKFFVEYQHDERMEGALVALVGTFPDVFLKHFVLYRSAAWSKATTEKLIECRPEVGHRLLLERFYGKSLTAKCLIDALDYALNSISNHEMLPVVFDQIKRERSPWIRDVLKVAAPKLEPKLTTGFMSSHLEIIDEIYSEYDGEPWCQKFLISVRKAIGDEKERANWRKRAEIDPDNTVAEIVSDHLDKSWAIPFLMNMCNRDLGLRAIYNAFDDYAEERGGIQLFLQVVTREPRMALVAWPLDAHGCEDEVVKVVADHYASRSDGVPWKSPDGKRRSTEEIVFWLMNLDSYNKVYNHEMITFCLQNPDSTVTKKLIARIKKRNPRFAKMLKKPNALVTFLKKTFGRP